MRRIIQRKKPLKCEINFEKIGKAISIFTLFSTSIGRVLDIIQQKEERGGIWTTRNKCAQYGRMNLCKYDIQIWTTNCV